MPPNCQTLYNIIQSSYFSSCGDVNYDKRGDLNKDRTINVNDFGIFRTNSQDDVWCLDRLNDPTDPCATSSTTTSTTITTTTQLSTTTTIQPEFTITSFVCSSYGDRCYECSIAYTSSSSQKAAMFLFTDTDGKVWRSSLENINIGSAQAPTAFCCNTLSPGAYKVSYWIYDSPTMGNLIAWSGPGQKAEVVC